MDEPFAQLALKVCMCLVSRQIAELARIGLLVIELILGPFIEDIFVSRRSDHVLARCAAQVEFRENRLRAGKIWIKRLARERRNIEVSRRALPGNQGRCTGGRRAGELRERGI